MNDRTMGCKPHAALEAIRDLYRAGTITTADLIPERMEHIAETIGVGVDTTAFLTAWDTIQEGLRETR